MKVAIMQPYFMPYLGYFSLIKKSDRFILFDTPQFIRHGWIERNQIIKPTGEPFYIKIPLVKHSRDTVIKDVKIKNSEDWKNKIIAQLSHYKKKAPYYSECIDLLDTIFKLETDSIVKLNEYSLKNICSYLRIDTPITIWSEMNLPIDEVNAADEWALNICKAMQATTYYNPTGGMSFFNKSKYINNNIDLNFIELNAIEYKQFNNTFTPFMSIIDVLMFNSIKDINVMIDNVTIIK